MKNTIGDGMKMFRKYQLAVWRSIQNFYLHFTKVTCKCECFSHIVEPCVRAHQSRQSGRNFALYHQKSHNSQSEIKITLSLFASRKTIVINVKIHKNGRSKNTPLGVESGVNMNTFGVCLVHFKTHMLVLSAGFY